MLWVPKIRMKTILKNIDWKNIPAVKFDAEKSAQRQAGTVTLSGSGGGSS